jgi:hypothetical protein
MTNFISDVTVPIQYLLGLSIQGFESSHQLTSTNNYLSAAEIEALPIPRMGNTRLLGPAVHLREEFKLLIADPADSIPGWLERIEMLSDKSSKWAAVSIPSMIELVVRPFSMICHVPVAGLGQTGALWYLLDALVLKGFTESEA